MMQIRITIFRCSIIFAAKPSQDLIPQSLLSLENVKLGPERSEAMVDGRGFDSATARPSGVLARSQSCSHLWANQYAFQHGSSIACIYPTAAMDPWESIFSSRGYPFCHEDSPYSILFSYVFATEHGQIHQEKAALPPETFHPSPRRVNLAQHKIKRGISSDSAKVVSLGVT